MKNLTIEQTRTSRMKHCMIKKFVPVFQRMEEQYVKPLWNVSGKYMLVSRYDKGDLFYYFNFSKTSIPKKIWPIARAKRKKAGQLSLWN